MFHYETYSWPFHVKEVKTVKNLDTDGISIAHHSTGGICGPNSSARTEQVPNQKGFCQSKFCQPDCSGDDVQYSQRCRYQQVGLLSV